MTCYRMILAVVPCCVLMASAIPLCAIGKYDLDFKNPGGKQQLTGPELIQLYKDLAAKYPIVSIEDPFDQVGRLSKEMQWSAACWLTSYTYVSQFCACKCLLKQDDWGNYAPFTKDVGDKIQVVGDDLLVTNPKRIKEAAEKKACNALLLKVRPPYKVISWALRVSSAIDTYGDRCVCNENRSTKSVPSPSPLMLSSFPSRMVGVS